MQHSTPLHIPTTKFGSKRKTFGPPDKKIISTSPNKIRGFVKKRGGEKNPNVLQGFFGQHFGPNSGLSSVGGGADGTAYRSTVFGVRGVGER